MFHVLLQTSFISIPFILLHQLFFFYNKRFHVFFTQKWRKESEKGDLNAFFSISFCRHLSFLFPFFYIFFCFINFCFTSFKIRDSKFSSRWSGGGKLKRETNVVFSISFCIRLSFLIPIFYILCFIKSCFSYFEKKDSLKWRKGSEEGELNVIHIFWKHIFHFHFLFQHVLLINFCDSSFKLWYSTFSLPWSEEGKQRGDLNVMFFLSSCRHLSFLFPFLNIRYYLLTFTLVSFKLRDSIFSLSWSGGRKLKKEK